MVVARTSDGKIGVKVDRMPLPDDFRINPPVWDPPTFLEELDLEERSCASAIIGERRLISWREEEVRRNPHAALVDAQRDYGIEKDVSFALERHRAVIDDCDHRITEMRDLKLAWVEHEDYVAERTFRSNGVQDDESFQDIRRTLRRHAWNDDIEDLTEALENEDTAALAEILEAMQERVDKYGKRHNSPLKTFLGFVHTAQGLYLTIDTEEIGPSVAVNAIRCPGFGAPPAPKAPRRLRGQRHGRAPRARRAGARSPGSRRGSKATARGGGDPPGGSSSGDGSEPPGLGQQLHSSEVVAHG